jgi:hypothetical protein
MKKLLIAMGCVAAIILMSSCTADNIEDSNKSINNNIQQTPTPSADTGDINKDLTH